MKQVVSLQSSVISRTKMGIAAACEVTRVSYSASDEGARRVALEARESYAEDCGDGGVGVEFGGGAELCTVSSCAGHGTGTCGND